MFVWVTADHPDPPPAVSQLIDDDDEALMLLLNLEGSKPGKICASFEDLERHRREEEQRKAEEEARRRLEEEQKLFAEARKNMVSQRVPLEIALFLLK